MGRLTFSIGWRLGALAMAAAVACSDGSAPEPVEAPTTEALGDVMQPVWSGQPCPTDGKPCRVARLGDSITLGEKVYPIVSSVDTPGAYGPPLFDLLQAAGKRVDFVGDRGAAPAGWEGDRDLIAWPGFRMDQIHTQISTSPPILTQLRPHIILIHIGTNDVNQGATLAQLQSRWGNLMGYLHSSAPQALVIWAGIVSLADPAKDSLIVQYNQWVSGRIDVRSSLYGYKEAYVDMHADLVRPDDFVSATDAHPNAQGYSKMASGWASALLPVLP
jgi:lysophospholipase L1-like esterase